MKDQATRGEADKAVKDLAKNKDQLHPNQTFVYTYLKVDSECWHFWKSELNLCKTFCHNYTGCIRLACLLYVLSNDSVNGSIEMMRSHTNCICLTFSTVRFKCFFKSPCREYAWPLVYNLFGFQMHPQIACLNRCKFALTAFVYSSPLCVLKLL